jgi:hypothetical protein
MTKHTDAQVRDAVTQTSQAHRDGIRTLYKYMPYPPQTQQTADALERRRRVEALLHRGELYFATASELNDPFEAAPRFHVPGASSDDTIEAVLRPLRTIYAPRFGWSEQQLSAKEASLRQEILSGQFRVRMQGLEQTWRARFASEYPLCCLSATSESIQMWSYYADSHRGICVHFDATTAPFGNAFRVAYSDEYPQVPVPAADVEPELLATRILATKSQAWCHEKEYRLINMPMEMQSDSGRVLDGIFAWQTPQLAIIPQRYVVGVSVGASMAENEVESILRIANDRPSAIPVCIARCKQDRYELEFAHVGV